MPALLPIYHPADKEAVHYWVFAAFGFVPSSCKRIKCTLTDKNKKEVGTQKIVCQPGSNGFWAVGFDVQKDLKKDPYALELSDANTGAVLATSRNLSIGLADGTVKPLTGGTTITYPASGGTVPSTFVAYGPTNQTTVSASMIEGTNQFNSAGHIMGSGWYADFPNVTPSATDWTLEVFDNQSGGNPSDTHTEITVT